MSADDDVRGERLAGAVSSVLEHAERPGRAWMLVAAGLLITAACWYVALFHRGLLPSVDDETLAGSPLVLRLRGLAPWGIVGGVMLGPFVATYATLQQVMGRDPDTEAADALDIMANFAARARAERQRRIVLTSAFAAVISVTAFYVALS